MVLVVSARATTHIPSMKSLEIKPKLHVTKIKSTYKQINTIATHYAHSIVVLKQRLDNQQYILGHFPTTSAQTSSTKIELGLDNMEFTSTSHQWGVNGLLSTHWHKYTLITYLSEILYSQVTLNRHGYQILVNSVVSTPCKGRSSSTSNAMVL